MHLFLGIAINAIRIAYPISGLYLVTEIANYYGYDSIAWYVAAWVVMFIIGIHPIGTFAIVCFLSYSLYATLNYHIATTAVFFVIGLALTVLGYRKA